MGLRSISIELYTNNNSCIDLFFITLIYIYTYSKSWSKRDNELLKELLTQYLSIYK